MRVGENKNRKVIFGHGNQPEWEERGREYLGVLAFPLLRLVYNGWYRSVCKLCDEAIALV